MKTAIGSLLGLVLSVSVSADPLVEGRVRLSDGLPVAGAQVLLFDLAELRQGAVAQATTDADGQFRLALPSVEGRARPEGFALGPNYPNPFNPSTIIPYHLSASAAVRLEVFNLLGQRIATLVDAEQSAGAYTVLWDATNAAGQAVGAGVYIYRLTVGGAYQTGRMVLLDGQAGVPTAAGSVGSGPAAVAVERAYGLAVMGSGVAYVDPSFRVVAGMAPVELVVEAVASRPRAKVAASRILGDVDNDGQVTGSDVVYILRYSHDSSVVLPNGGDITLGDVNGDGAVNGTDAVLLVRFIADPSDPSLPPGIGQAVPEALVPMPAVRLTDNDDDDWDPAWSPDGQRIAFVSNRDERADQRIPFGPNLDGDNDISVMNADGSGVTQLTQNDDVLDWQPAWSPDGQRIAFVSDRDGDSEIYVMNADGSDVTQLSQNGRWDGDPAWSPDGQRIAFVSDRDGDSEIYVMNADGSDVTRLTHDGGGDPAWSPDGQRIAFASGRDGDLEIYVMNADGSGVTRLTHNDALDWQPAWSPDGRRIAFTSTRDGRYGEIYVMNADGSGVTRLTHNDASDWQPAWSPDGRRIAFVSHRDGRYGEIYVMNAAGEPVSTPGDDSSDDDANTPPEAGSDGSDVTQLTHNDDDDWDPAWSPDGQRIAFVSDHDGRYGEIYVMNTDGSDVTRLTHNRRWDGSPAWSPDGRRIAFVSDRHVGSIRSLRGGGWSIASGSHRDGRGVDIYVMNADGSDVTRLTHDGGNVYRVNADGSYVLSYTYDGGSAPAWSPDGRRIAFHSDRDRPYDYNIYVMNADGSDATQLTHNDDDDWDPAWSPDGQRIAFVSDHDGDSEIYVMNADGSDVTQLTHNDDDDWDPAWSPDGQRIAFVSDHDGDSEIYVMNADGSDVTQLTHNDDDDWDPAWSPDGQRIAFVSDHDGDSEIYVLMLNQF